MIRSDLIRLIAIRFTQFTPLDAEAAVQTILEAMNHAMVQGHRVEIRGFGTFAVLHRASRMGRNPRTGEPVNIPKKRVVLFKAGKALRVAVDPTTA